MIELVSESSTQGTRTRRSVGTLVALLAVSGCAAGSAPELPRSRTVPGVERVAAPADAPVTQAVAGIRSFADVFGGAIAREGGNTVFSPLSMAAAFAMLRAAADGETASQLDAVFGFPEPGVHTAFNTLTRGVITTDAAPARETTRKPDEPPPPPVVTIANGLFVQEGLELGPEFLRTLAEQYGAAAQEVDFAAPEEAAAREINAWVDRHTAGRIDRLFDELDPNTITVLANAVYLKAFWQMPFDEGRTKDAPFHRADGSTVNAPTMRLVKPTQLRYLHTPDWEAVRLPYTGDELAMWIMVPTGTATTPRFDRATLDALARAEPRTVDVVLPRWDFATDLSLLGVLGDLGLTDVADLPGISGSAFVSDAVHRANITVDEQGTEAAAVTGIAIAESASPEPEITVRADRPFAFAITHEPTGTPVFLGTVADPTAS